jgi:hypothetical protein
MYRLVALFCLIALLRSLPAMAQTEIHHCIGSNGGAVFTDQPCSALQATTAQPAPASAAGASLPSPNRPHLILCAASLGRLRQSVIEAFASRDANRMAGRMLWAGYGRGAAIADIRSLAVAMRQPLVGVDVPGSGDTDMPAPDALPGETLSDLAAQEPAAAAPATSANQLVLHTGGNDGSAHELRFDIVRQAGCLWLRNAY